MNATQRARPRLDDVKTRLARQAGPAIRSWRLLLAAKAALATGLAWGVGPLIPGSLDDYSYYAPLGALISMTPTLMGSIRQSAQTAASLGLGVTLAWLVLAIGEPPVLSVPLAVGVGVLLAGLPLLGPGRDYVPIAALFVLVIGGGDAGDYSLGYVVQMAVGMAIGIAVNLIVVPPLYLRDAAGRISSLRRDTERRLNAVADAIREKRLDEENWRPELDALNQHLEAARRTVDDARESRRGNPRRRWHRYDVQEDYDDLRALRRIGYHVFDIAEALSDERGYGGLTEGLRTHLAAVLDATAALVRAWEERKDEVAAAESAKRELDRLTAALEVLHPPGAPPNEALAAALFDLRRMVTLVERRLRSTRAAA